MPLLTAREIKAQIDSGQIEVFCHFFRDEEGGAHFRERCKPIHLDEDDRPRSWLWPKITGVRLGLTLGPLLKMIGSQSVDSDIRFKNMASIADLRKCEYFRLNPGESVSAYTNEVVSIPKNIAALLVGRVTNDANGLNVKTSYVNNSWCGFIRIRIKNESPNLIRIYHGMDIAGLFCLSAGEGDGSYEKVEHGAHFEGNWGKVFDQNVDPFSEAVEKENPKPLRGSDRAQEFFTTVGGYWREFLVGGVLLTFAVGIGSTLARLNQVEQATTRLQDRTREFERLDQNVGRLPIVGQVTIILPREGGTRSKRIPLRGVAGSPDYAFANILRVEDARGNSLGSENFKIDYRYEENANDGNLIVNVEKLAPSSNSEVATIQYIVVRRVD